MQTKDNPLKALGVLAGLMAMIVMITVIISTVIFWRNKRSNKVMPRRIIRRRQNYQTRTIRLDWLKFKSLVSVRQKFTVQEDDKSLQNENSNNNLLQVLPPLPPTAPVPPPAPTFKPSLSELRVPTVSGSLSPKIKSKHVKKKGLANTAHNALVSELKLRDHVRNRGALY
ncbi:UNVERIFIED_CONTAM: Cadherin- member 1 [Gekko kuhli]